MGPELETTGAELRFSLLSFTDYPGAGTRDARHTKSLIYNISLMVGQTCGYEFERQEIEAAPANFAVAICSCY